MKLIIDGWANGAPIPDAYAFGKIPNEGRFTLANNINPALSWADVPLNTKSFALICVDSDVPSSSEDVNKEGRIISSDLPRVDFYHWVLVNIPANLRQIDKGTESSAITPRGKAFGLRPYGMTGVNSYTDWFKGDADMAGNYGGYDGPCPPWNDSLVHRYRFTIYALDIESLEIEGAFTGADALEAMEGHILSQASYTGVYTMNRDLVPNT